ncbi:MAG: Ig-like domain-containing protein, partial [Planctomycetota bacterium]
MNDASHVSSLPASSVSSSTTPTAGIVGGAQSFDGTSSFINLGNDAKYDDVFDGGGTVSAWINANGWGDSGHGRIIDKATDRFPSPAGWSLAVDDGGSGGKIAFELGFSGNYGRWLSAEVLNLNTWHNVVVTYNSSSASFDPIFYLDGVQIATYQASSPVGTSGSDAGQDLAIGNQSTNLNRAFDGIIDEVRIEDGIKSQDEILADLAAVQGTLVSFGAEEAGMEPGVLVNDTDADGDPLTATLVNGPSNAQSFTLNADGSFEYVPLVGFSGVDTFDYEVSDGGLTSTATATINITDINVAPVLDDAASYSLLDVIENNVNPTGTSVSALLASGGVSVITDSDVGDSEGIVVTNVDDTNGTWEFSTNGTTWTSFSSAGGSGSANVNVLLDGSDRIRFVPDAAYVGSTGNITFRAWDQSAGSAGDGDADLSTTGGNSAFSAEEATATGRVMPSGGFSIDVPVTQFTAQNTPMTFTVADGNVTQFDDGLAGDELVRLELSSSEGTMSILHTSGITFDEGTSNNSSNIVVYGIKSEISQALEDLTFTPNAGFSGAATIAVDVGTYGQSFGSYEFEDGTASDSSPNSNNGTIDPGMAHVDAERGNVLSFNGAQQVSIPTNFGQTADFSLASWVNFDSADANQELIAIGEGVRITQFSEANGGLTAFYNVGGTWQELNSGLVLPQNEWHHIGFSFDNSDQRLYIDGAEVASASVAGTVAYLGDSTTVGVDVNDGGRNFSGMMDDFHVFGAVLMPEQFGAMANNSDEVTGNIAVTVDEPPPTANDDSVTFLEGEEGWFDILGNDTETFASIDPATVQITSGPSNGAVFVAPDGTVRYTHNGGETTSDEIRYRVADVDGRYSMEATISITITPQNDTPVAGDDGFTVIEGQTHNQTTTVFTNDADPDGPSATGTIVSGPSHGTLTWATDGTFTYEHDGSETIADQFTYEINDGDGGTDQATVFITITPENDVPIANDDYYTVNEGIGFGDAVGVLANDVDDDGPTATATIVTLPSHGTLSFNTDGTFNYTHDGSETTSDQFTYQVSDGDGGSDQATVFITITPQNDTPVAGDDSFTVNEGDIHTDSTGVLVNDIDDDGPSATVTLVSGPSHGTLHLNTDGTFSYDHDGSETTSDTFTYQVDDGDGGTDQATVSITINPVNDVPDTHNDSFTVDEGGLHVETTSVFNNDIDDDGPGATGTIVTGPSHGTLNWNSDGTFSYEHDGGESTTDQFTYEIDDGAGGTNQANVLITINPINDVPVANDDSFVLEEGDTFFHTASVFDNDADPDGPSATGNIVSGPSNGTLTWNSDGTFIYEHDGSETVSDEFTYTIEDGDGGSDQAVVNITINPVNDAPTATDDLKQATAANELTFSEAELLANDSDSESDAFSIVVLNQPLNGTISSDGMGNLVYLANDGFSGEDSFTYVISDGVDSSNPATVTLDVILPPPPPTNPSTDGEGAGGGSSTGTEEDSTDISSGLEPPSTDGVG